MQLGRGRLEAYLFRMPLEGAVLNAGGHNSLPVSTTAAMPEGKVTFGTLLRAPAWGDFNGQPHSIGGCQVLGPSAVLLGHSAPGMEFATFQADREAVRDRAHLLGRDPRVPGRAERFCIPGTAPAAQLLKEHLRRALEVATQPALRPGNFSAETFRSLVADEITTLAALTLGQTPPSDIPAFRRRRAIVEQAREYMDANAGQMISLTELCRVTLSSERALQYAFREVTGLSPTTYLRMRALHGARAEFRNATAGEVTVTEIAMRWGFWHLSRFAASYRGTFGTPPSQALGGARKAVPPTA
jgi:AraC family ethanolamine operon transcriptional activator